LSKEGQNSYAMIFYRICNLSDGGGDYFPQLCVQQVYGEGAGARQQLPVYAYAGSDDCGTESYPGGGSGRRSLSASGRGPGADRHAAGAFRGGAHPHWGRGRRTDGGFWPASVQDRAEKGRGVRMQLWKMRHLPMTRL